MASVRMGFSAWMIAATVAVPAAVPPAQAQAQAQAPAQNEAAAPPQQGREVVVEGKVAPDRKDVRAQVRAVSPQDDSQTPLARFRAPLCLAMIGVQRAVGEAILDRMVQDAEEAKIAMAGDRCDPNVILLFVDDGKVELSGLAKHRHWLVEGLPFEDYRALMKQKGPVRAWSMKEVTSRDGDRLQYDNNGPPTLKVPAASRLSAPIRRDILVSVLMIDRGAAIGKSPTQLADYAAMRTFALTHPANDARLDTILTLFDGTAAPAELTSFDRGYLRGLYTGQANNFSSTQRSTIARSIDAAARGMP